MAKKKIEPNEAIMNLLIVKLLLDGVEMKLIEQATGLDEKTIYARFPMKLIKEARERKMNGELDAKS